MGLNDFSMNMHVFVAHLLCLLCFASGRGAQDREDVSGSGLGFSLSSSHPLQAELHPPPCEDGLPCEGWRSSREEGQLGAHQGQTPLLT